MLPAALGSGCTAFAMILDYTHDAAQGQAACDNRPAPVDGSARSGILRAMNGRMFRAVLFALGAGLGPAATAAPKADIATTAWQLDLEFYDPQRITLRLPGDDHETTFWYVLYQATNRTGKDVGFYPSFRIVTDSLQVLEGGANVSPTVYDAIKARHYREFPFFAPPAKVTGLLLQGEENARASAAVFKTFDDSGSGFTLYISGLSGESERVRNPAFDVQRGESEDNPRAFFLRRTLAVVYDLPGDPQTRASATPVRRSREWVMR